MAEIIIVKKEGLERIVYEEDNTNLIFGFSNTSTQDERMSIGRALHETGLDVYYTNTLWPNDSYILQNGVCLPEKDFGKLAHGGNYVFGPDFVLVSSRIVDELHDLMKKNDYVKKLFEGKEIVLINPYNQRLTGVEGNELQPEHIDLTVGSVPFANLLSADKAHYEQEKKTFDYLTQKYGLKLTIVAQGANGQGQLCPNNFYTVNNPPVVVANSMNNPLKGVIDARVVETDEAICYLPGKFGGSVKCVTNESPTTELWDALGIDYHPLIEK